jgi:hypothetical protein
MIDLEKLVPMPIGQVWGGDGMTDTVVNFTEAALLVEFVLDGVFRIVALWRGK